MVSFTILNLKEYKMNLDFNFFTRVFSQYTDFTGRDSREQYWMFILFYMIIYIGLTVVDSILTGGLLGMLFSLALLIPSIAIATRRLHDIGKSGWWQIIVLIPLIGLIVLIVWLATPGVKEANQYGESPSS